VLRQLLDKVATAGPLTPPLEALIARLRTLDTATLEFQADAIFAQRFEEVDPASAPFIVAALQVALDRRRLPPWTRDPCRTPIRTTLCPVCGAHPVASVLRIGGAVWQLPLPAMRPVRDRVAHGAREVLHCDSKGVRYLGLDAGRRVSRRARSGIRLTHAVLAETCDECHVYRKMVNQEQDYVRRTVGRRPRQSRWTC
jgi:FdhE protein